MADFRGQIACSILLEYADSKKQLRYILCGFLRCFSRKSRLPDALGHAPVDGRRTDPFSASPGPAWPVHPCPFACRCNPAPGAPSRLQERSSSCSLPVENMLANRFRIAAFGRKDAPPVGQLHRHHPIRWMQQIVQHRRDGRSSDAASCECNRSELGGLLARKAELDAPAEHHARDDAMAAADLRHTHAG